VGLSFSLILIGILLLIFWRRRIHRLVSNVDNVDNVDNVEPSVAVGTRMK
jgi:hypothetical protein